MPAPRSILLLLCLAHPLAAARAGDLWVGPPGSGQPYSSVQAAIDAAQPGDRVLLLPGSYGPARIDKPLQLTGAGSGSTRLLAPAGVVPLEVAGAGSSGRVRLGGFELGLEPGVDAAPQAFLWVHGLAGRLEAVDLKIARLEHDAHPAGGAYLWIQDCAQAQFSAVRVYTEAGLGGSDAHDAPLAGLLAQGSRVWFSDGRLEASDLCLDLTGDKPGAAGIRLENSELHLALCNTAGGSAQGSSRNLAGGPALVLEGSRAVLYGGKSNQMRGGHAAASGPGGAVLAAPGAALSADSALVHGADVVFTPGAGPSGSAALPLWIEPGALYDPRPDRLPSMWIPTPIGPLGQNSAVFLEGDPGAVQFWWLVLETAPAIDLPGIFGPFLLDTSLVVHHPPVWLNVDGQGSDLAFAPGNPNLQGRMLAYQSIEFDGLNLQLAPPWFVSFELL